jgi:cation-transporting P-type ATPase C
MKNEIEEYLINLPEIISAKITPITGSCLVYFDNKMADAQSICESSESIIGTYSRMAYKLEWEARNQPTINERRLEEAPLSEMVTRVFATTLTLAYTFVRRKVFTPPNTILEKVLNIPMLTVFSIGWPIFKSGFNSIINDSRPNADTLSSAAIIASLITGSSTSALTIIWLSDIAELLTAYSMDRTRKAISEMLTIGEEFVWLLKDDGSEIKVPLDSLSIGDRIVTHAGEKISVDGVIESGEATVDQSSITGEYMPVQKK